MEFIETSVFTRIITELLDPDEYRTLQDALILRPEAGDVIPGAEGRGKRGGLRVIYYFKNDMGQIYLLYAYPKNKRENLTQEQKDGF